MSKHGISWPPYSLSFLYDREERRPTEKRDEVSGSATVGKEIKAALVKH